LSIPFFSFFFYISQALFDADLDDLPSSSVAPRVAAKPALSNWRQGNAKGNDDDGDDDSLSLRARGAFVGLLNQGTFRSIFFFFFFFFSFCFLICFLEIDRRNMLFEFVATMHVSHS
jgi:hypothetical protein